MFPLLGSRFLILQQLDYNNGNGMFLRGPCRDVISKGQGHFSMGLCEERTSECEAEECPLLEAIARERLVNTPGWERLSRCCDNS
jgi:hypothetical protein